VPEHVSGTCVAQSPLIAPDYFRDFRPALLSALLILHSHALMTAALFVG